MGPLPFLLLVSVEIQSWILTELKDNESLEIVTIKVGSVHKEKRYVLRRLTLMPRGHNKVFILLCLTWKLRNKLFVGDIVPPFTVDAAGNHIPATADIQRPDECTYFLNSDSRRGIPNKCWVEALHLDFEIGCRKDAYIRKTSIPNLKLLDAHVAGVGLTALALTREPRGCAATDQSRVMSAARRVQRLVRRPDTRNQCIA